MRRWRRRGVLFGPSNQRHRNQWLKVFQWRKGQISFHAPQSTLSNNPVMAIALDLAASLSASIVGDEGEPYDGSF
jgi:hypothetical protein